MSSTFQFFGGLMPRETGKSGYKVKLKKTLHDMFPGIIIQDQDPNVIHPGIPDLMLLHNGRWAMLEVKAAADSDKQENQDYWVDFYNARSFASFIYPENEEEVLHALQGALASSGNARHA
jgi:hypothetical protein